MIRWRSILWDSTTDARFRAWGLEIHDALAALGWIQTADTGQIDWTTVLAPTLTLQKRGYEIWRANDSLAGSAPFYIKLTYGSSGAAARPGLWIQIGAGSNGAGTLSDASHENIQSTGNSQNAVAVPVVFLGDAGRFNIITDPAQTKSGEAAAVYIGWERTSEFNVFNGQGAVTWGRYYSFTYTTQIIHKWGTSPRPSFYEIMTAWGDQAPKGGHWRDGSVFSPVFYNLTHGFPVGELQSMVIADPNAVARGVVVTILFQGEYRPFLFTRKITSMQSVGAGGGATYCWGFWYV